MENKTLKTWEKEFDSYKYSNPEVGVQIDAGWYDWFCDDNKLASKTKTLGKKIKQIINSSKINKDTMYVFFKNNCPMNGPLYDSFSFCDIETGDVMFWITPRSGHSGKAEVYSKENGFSDPDVQGTWADVKNYFNK